MSYLRKALMVIISLIGLLALTTTVAFAQDPENGKIAWEDSLCQRCHGPMGEGGWAAVLAGQEEGDHDHSAEEWIEQIREPRRRMPAFSEEQISDEVILDIAAYMATLEAPAENISQRPELPADAHPGQQLLVEKRCAACHGITGPMRGFNTRAEPPTVESVLTQIRTPRNRMPSYRGDQVSEEEAAAIADFMAGQYQPVSELVPSAAEKAVAGIGGEEALQGLSTLSINSTGVRWVTDEAFEVGSPPKQAGPFSLQVNYDLANDSLRLDHNRRSLGRMRPVSEVIVGDIGYIDGQDANFGGPGVKAMSSDRWASTLRQQRLLNPHLILQDVLANPRMAANGGAALFNGSIHNLLVVGDAVAPITLYVNAGTGQIAKASTMENDALRRDVPVEVFYYSWQPVGESGLSFPAEVYLTYDGEIVLTEIRTAIEANGELDSAQFEIPGDVEAVFDEALAAHGESSGQYLQIFAAYGFPRDGLQTNVEAAELADGVYHVTGGSHHSMVIEQADGIVVAEAPLGETRSQAVIDWIAATFPDKPISYVVSSHHHVDHSAGLRTYVANGTTAVMHEAAADFFGDIFLADSSLVPDPLHQNPVEATIETVPADGSLVIEDDALTVEVYPIANSHAEDLVLTYAGGVVFVSDLYSPNPNADSAGAGGQLIADLIDELGLEVTTIAGGHGGTIDIDTFESITGGE